MDTILDKLEELKKRDRGGMLTCIRRFPEDCKTAIKLAEKVDLDGIIGRKFNAVVFLGMGGSAIGGTLVRDWLLRASSVPMTVSRGHHIPGFVNEETLVFTVSYSGNTEETLNACYEAMERRSTIVAVTSGGFLERISHDNGLPLVLMPEGMKPRAAIPYQFFMLATVLNRLGLITDSWAEVDEAINVLKAFRDELVPEVPSASNLAKRLAMSLRFKVPFVYGSKLLEGVAYRFRTQLNENSKVPAASGSFPEVFHNAVMGSEGPEEVLSPLGVLIIRDPEEDEVAKKVDRFRDLLRPRVGMLVEVEARGKGKLAKIMSMIYLGDYVSAYLGLLNGVDPGSTDSIEELKKI